MDVVDNFTFIIIINLIYVKHHISTCKYFNTGYNGTYRFLVIEGHLLYSDAFFPTLADIFIVSGNHKHK